MIAADGLVGFVLLGLWLYCIFDCISTDSALVRNLPKMVWLFIVLLIPDIGSIAWLILGRPERAGLRPGDTDYRPPARRYVAPEDRDGWTGDLDGLSPIVREREEQARLRMWEEQLRRREEELRKREGESGPAER